MNHEARFKYTVLQLVLEQAQSKLPQSFVHCTPFQAGNMSSFEFLRSFFIHKEHYFLNFMEIFTKYNARVGYHH